MPNALFYEYANCSTCKSFKKWLHENGIKFTSIPIVDQPPTVDELRTIHRQSGLPIKKLFNTSGQSYRAMNLSAIIDNLSDEDCYKLLAKDGKLIKRPILVSGKTVTIGALG